MHQAMNNKVSELSQSSSSNASLKSNGSSTPTSSDTNKNEQGKRRKSFLVKMHKKSSLKLPPQDRKRGSLLMKKSTGKEKCIPSKSFSSTISRLQFLDANNTSSSRNRVLRSSSSPTSSEGHISPSPSILAMAQIDDEITVLRQSIKGRNWNDVTQSLINLQNLNCSDVLSKYVKNGDNLLTLGIVNMAPLHVLKLLLDTIICNRNTDQDSDDAIIEVKKEIIMAKDDIYCDPSLHIACANGSPKRVIEWLLSIGQQEAVVQKNGFGFTPLHTACSSGSSIEIIEKIIEACDGYDIVLELNDNLQTPLHLACSRSNASLPIIQKLITLGGEVSNDYVHMKDNDGRNALNLSYMNEATVDVVMYILKVAGKDMLLEIDKNGLNHLQLACLNGASNDIIKRFVQIGGKELVLGHTNDFENPLLIACENNEITLDVAKEFVTIGGEEIIHKSNENGDNVLHLLCRNEINSVDVVRHFGQIGGGSTLVTKMNKDGYNVMHLACMNNSSNLELLRVLVELAGFDVVLRKDRNNGYNALHILARNSPSMETVKFILDVGGSHSLNAEDFRGNNPLHMACECLKANLIDIFVEMCDLQVISAMNFNKKTPLDILIQKKDRVSLDKLHSIQTKWFQLDRGAQTVPTMTNANLLNWARQLSDEELSVALNYGLLKSIMNKNFIQPINIAVLMTDLYIQFAIMIVYSFLIHPTITGEASSEIPRNILLVCFAWSAFRELNELFRIKSLYLLKSLNYTALLQLVLIMWTIMLFDGGGVYQIERIAYTLATGVSCLELLIGFGNLSYPIAVFIIALLKIFWILIPFLVSTFLIVLSFAHMFYMWSISSLDTCKVNDENFDRELNWTCNLSSSYAQTFSILITSNWSFLDEEAEGFQTSISYAFAFIVGILLLNVLIAIINNAFSNIERSGDLEYWRYRLSFENETQLLYSIGATFVRPLGRIVCEGWTLLFQDGLKSVSSKKKKAFNRRPKLEPEIRSNSIRDYFFSESSIRDLKDIAISRIRFDTFSIHEFNTLEDYEQNLFFNWWFDYPDSYLPSIKQRLWYYFTRASWDEIIFPAQSFENILIGIRFHEEGSGIRFVIARTLTYFSFMLNIIMLVVLFMLGLFTFGICWPRKMKERLFFGPLSPNQKNEHALLRLEMESKINLVRDEVSEVRDSLSKISSKQDEVMKAIITNQAQIAELVSLLRNAQDRPH